MSTSERQPRDEGEATEVEPFEGCYEPVPAGVEERVLARLAEAAAARHDRGLVEAAAALRQRRAARSSVASWKTWALAALAAAAAVLVTLALTPSQDDLEQPAAFVPTLPPPNAVPIDIRYDDRGRLSRIAPATQLPPADGEHLVFRGGRLIRVEHFRDGALDGPAYDFDATGGLIAIRTWDRGVERGPFVELDGKGRVTQQGAR